MQKVSNEDRLRTTGYVFRIDRATWGILRYLATGAVVEMFQTETVGAYAVCDLLQKQCHGLYNPADKDQAPWGRLVLKQQGGAVYI